MPDKMNLDFYIGNSVPKLFYSRFSNYFFIRSVYKKKERKKLVENISLYLMFVWFQRIKIFILKIQMVQRV